jgi:alpha-tubulin suppressor-like RCC1 family protein
MKTTRNLIKFCLLIAVLLSAVTTRATVTVTNIAAGNSVSHFLKSDGSLWAMGTVDGNLYNTNLPEQIVASNVMAIAAGDGHSLLLKSDGSLWAVGENVWGQLGDGNDDIDGTNSFEEILFNGVIAIAAGDSHSLFLKSDGSLWVMGANFNGQLGDGTYNSTNRPEQIVASNVVAIAAGAYHSLFLKSDGSLWAMGYNGSGQLGDGTSGSGVQTNIPEEIVSNGVMAIAAGGSHSLFLKSDGSLWAMGYNYYGQLGDGANFDTNLPEMIVPGGVMAISSGYDHSLFLESDGSLWAMGDNQHGELGDGASGLYNQAYRPEKIISNGVTAIAAGAYHSLFLKSDGSLWAMGINSSGELGDGTYNSINRPEQIVPDILFFASPTFGQMFLTVQFTAPSVDGGGNAITHWNWNFGDGSTGTGQNPAHVYKRAGIFSPRLMAINNGGNTVVGSDIVNYVLLSINVTSYPGLILNGNFETGDFTNWTLVGDTIYVNPYNKYDVTIYDVVETEYSYPSVVHSGGYGAFLGDNRPATLSQTLATIPGENYLLSLWLDNQSSGTYQQFEVDWDGNSLYSITNPPAFSWTNLQFLVTATGANTVLQFDAENDNAWFGLDDVSVLPEPGIASISHLAGTNLVFNVNNGLSGGTYYVLTTTNVALPKNQWMPVATNISSASGNFTLTVTNAVDPKIPQQFYIIQMQ